jgi:hypothetical protein
MIGRLRLYMLSISIDLQEELHAMSGELENQILETVKDKQTAQKLIQTVDAAGQEFPCLTCGSRDECATFQWFAKWFGQKQ